MKLLFKLLNPVVKHRISVLKQYPIPVLASTVQRGTQYFSTEKLIKDNKKPPKRERPKWGTNKPHRDIKLAIIHMMADPKIEAELAPLRESVKEQVIFEVFAS